uniref:Uncharacterized protein n=1 Tax=Panagrolaimus sp. JU765 TaxID=591449 RepID=A0AC34RTI3_9BILA
MDLEFKVTDKYTKWRVDCAISGVFKIKCLNGQKVSFDAVYELWEYDDDQNSNLVKRARGIRWGQDYVEADILVTPKTYDIIEPHVNGFMEFYWKWIDVCEKGKTVIMPNVKFTYFEI